MILMWTLWQKVYNLQPPSFQVYIIYRHFISNQMFCNFQGDRLLEKFSHIWSEKYLLEIIFLRAIWRLCEKKSLNRKAFVVVVAAAVADMNELSFLSLFRYNKKWFKWSWKKCVVGNWFCLPASGLDPTKLIFHSVRYASFAQLDVSF